MSAQAQGAENTAFDLIYLIKIIIKALGRIFRTSRYYDSYMIFVHYYVESP